MCCFYVCALFLNREREREAALAGVAQLVGALSYTQKGWGFDFPSGHMPGLQVRSHGGGTWRRQLIDVSLSHRCFYLCLTLPLSLKSTDIYFFKEKKKKPFFSLSLG